MDRISCVIVDDDTKMNKIENTYNCSLTGYGPLDSLRIAYLEGQKQYELTNHLGNVLVTVSDKKTAVDTTGGPPYLANYYLPVIINAQDYYPFGMVEPGRQYAILGDSSYRYAFNGKLHDDDIYGKDNSYDYGMRFYDPRLGRFMSVDPKFKDYAWQSLYAYIRNNPIDIVDLNGEGDPNQRAENGKKAAKDDKRPYGEDNDPTHVDCSRHTSEVAKLDGLIFPKGVRKAQQQKDYFKKNEYYSNDIKDAKIGDYIYFGNGQDKVTHTGVIVGQDKNGNFIISNAQVHNTNGHSIATATLDKNGNLFPGKKQLNFVGVGRPKIENTNSATTQEKVNNTSPHNDNTSTQSQPTIQAAGPDKLSTYLYNCHAPVLQDIGKLLFKIGL
jgi:RHS repeat-associated protein